jgi:GST-like protein
MIQLYYAPTPNGHKVSVALEELGLPYEARGVNILTGDQFKPEFLAISPNNRIPAIVDPDGPGGAPISVFESGAILIYLAEKTGRLLPADPRRRVAALEWLMWQMGGFGPMLGQAHHFLNYAPEAIPYAQNRYRKETERLYGVLERRLEGREYVADEYSVADIAIYPWAAARKHHRQSLEALPNVAAWVERIGARPAVARGLALMRELLGRPMDDEAKKTLFGIDKGAQ